MCVLTVGLVAAWLVSLRVGRDWLRPGHGPLWYVAGALVVLIGAVFAALPPGHSARAVYDVVARPDTFNAFVRALLLLVLGYALLRGLFGALYRGTPTRPPVPRAFLLGGIAPDGSPLASFRWCVRWLTIVGLLVAILAIPAMALASGPQVEYTTWAFSYAGLVACLFASTHPVEPMQGEAEAPQVARARGRRPLAARADRLHRWLGSPDEVERLPPIRRGAPTNVGPKRDGLLLGLHPYGYQWRICNELADAPAIALAGPEGTGRTTAALMRAADLALRSGFASVFVTPTQDHAARALRHARALMERIPAGATVDFAEGARIESADIWIVSIDDLERFLDETVEPSSNELLSRVRLVVVEDVELLFGPAIATARFLVHRLCAAARQGPPATLVSGNVAPEVLKSVAMCVVARDVTVIPTAGAADRHGAGSSLVRRFIVDPDAIDHSRTATAGMHGIRRGFQQIVESVDRDEDRLLAELFGEPWESYLSPMSRTLRGDCAPEVLLASVDARNAWRVLGHRRYYASSEGESREYLVVAADPVPQLLHRSFRATGKWWPAWYDVNRYPRVLSAVPGVADAPAGLLRQAREHLRRALDEGLQEVARLRAVFSPQVVDGELESMSTSRLFEQFESWQPNPDDAKAPKAVGLCRHPGHTRRGRDRRRDDLACLRSPSTGETHFVHATLLDLDYFENAIVRLGGRRYRVGRRLVDHRGEPDAISEREIRLEPSTAVSTAIRRIRFTRGGDAPLERSPHRFLGREGLFTLRGPVQLHLRHEGMRTFARDERDPAGRMGAWEGLARDYEQKLDVPVLSSSFFTRAWIVCVPAADEVVLHTLTHVLRGLVDYFYFGASDFIGLSYELDIDGLRGIVFYDRTPEGTGCLNDIDEMTDLRDMLDGAREILASCTCASNCPRCCDSTSCTLTQHNVGLDRHRALAVLDKLLSRGA